MFGINDVLEVIGKVNANCVEMDKLYSDNVKAYENELASVKKSTEELKASMQDNLKKYCENNFAPVRKKLLDIVELMRKDYKDEAAAALSKLRESEEDRLLSDSVIEDDDFEEVTSSGSSAALRPFNSDENDKPRELEDLKKKFYQLVDKINGYIDTLNAFDFDEAVPPVTVKFPTGDAESFETSYMSKDASGKKTEVKHQHYYDDQHKRATEIKEVMDRKVLSKWASTICNTCVNAVRCLDDIEICYKTQFDIASFDKFMDSQSKLWLSETKARLDSAYDNRFAQLFCNEDAGAIKRSFFTGLEKTGQEADVDPAVGSAVYGEHINIGDVKMLVDRDKNHLKYFAASPTLGKYMADGYLACPLILDLKEHGNVLINLPNDDYSQNAKDFINQLIIQFLLTFPANRINFCLVDIDNMMNFSQYKTLTKINSNILFNGIIRDDRQLADTIKDLERTMFTVEEERLSLNNVKDIYEYNAKFEANPQSVHLFVLVNYPSGIRDDTIKHISKIMKDGNKAGIFTIIINNKSCALQPGFKREDNAQFLALAEQCSVTINCDGSRFSLNIPSANEFVPKKDIKTDMLPGIIDMLKDAAESNRQKVIPLSQMFDNTDALRKKAKGIAPSEEVLDIPIGARGGEIQNLLLKTTGDGSAHAVVIGGTGSGKSNLLHTIIMSACYKYSPEELNLYLVDFKGGVEFKYYEANKDRAKQLPHIKLTGLTSDLEDGVSILNNLHKELRRREDEFRICRVEDIVQYRATGKSMPRLFVIIDEIQELFEQDERLGQKAIDILRELFKKGRAFGINILWASQNIPKSAPGLRDKVLSQIGNRISLRLNEPDDAIDVKIDPKVVRNLNRPEKGLGVINDIRYGNDSVEFRVAYAETSENRQKYSQMIIDKWKNVKGAYAQAPLYIVGDDDEPSPVLGNTVYTQVPSKKDIVSKAFEKYNVQLGQDYVTGQPFDMDIAIRSDKDNILVAGYDIEIIRDMMGYALLSTIVNQATNADCVSPRVKLYYANGEMINPKNSQDLFNVLHSDFGDMIETVSSPAQMKDCVKDLYKKYKERAAEADTSEYAKAYAPYFVVVHSLQRYADLFGENPNLQLSDTSKQATAAAPPTGNSMSDALSIFSSYNASRAAASDISSSSSGMPDSIHFTDAFRELLDRGGKYGVHFIMSIDNPLGIQAISKSVQEIKYKVFVKGIPTNVMAQVLGDYKVSSSLTNPKVALVAAQDEHTKIRVYRYDEAQDKKWYDALCKNYKELIKG